ncbi:hypothetical protein niasHS_005092 [Heterodera schachtii]|uniref:UDP-N-acetylglucosamine diphosphorylase n=1 Tax=Heterodera schachtii TaxID=97005 RepID=A0ABD2JLU1_HETSC
MKAIAEGRVAAVVLAGGQASRLGSAQPKGVLPLGTRGLGKGKVDSLLFIQSALILRLQRLAAIGHEDVVKKSGGRITWLVMTNGTNDVAVRSHIIAICRKTKLSLDQIIVFSQKETPAFDFDGNVLMKSRTELATAPDGHGGFYEAVRPHLSELEKRGVQYLLLYCVDNILCRVAGQSMIGYAIEQNADCVLKVVEKSDPYELVDKVIREGERFRVLQCSETPSELAERRCPMFPSKFLLRKGNIESYMVTFGFLRKACDLLLPYHAVCNPNGIKLERFIFDAFVDQDVFLWLVSTEEEYSPLKNQDAVGTAACRVAWRVLGPLMPRGFAGRALTRALRRACWSDSQWICQECIDER